MVPLSHDISLTFTQRETLDKPINSKTLASGVRGKRLFGTATRLKDFLVPALWEILDKVGYSAQNSRSEVHLPNLSPERNQMFLLEGSRPKNIE
jgi:hypothetical protein